MKTKEELISIAKHVRIQILKQVYQAQSGHPGGTLGCADILCALYFNEMDITKENVSSLERDRFVLSKGHCSPALYAVLAEKGILREEELLTFRQIGSSLQGHPNKNETPGVDMSTGSLGQGIAAACGMAIANKLSNNTHRIYTLLGDGECEEGEVWEAAMAAHHYQLDNLCAIVDLNGLQIDGYTKDVIDPNPIPDKFASFGWHVVEVDGHDFDQLQNAFQEARSTEGVPTVIVAKTTKGKGVSFMEDQAEWHGKAPNQEQFEQALLELEGQ